MIDESLKTKILGWLEKQGFPLELRVAKAFQEMKFNVVQSSYYNDFEEQKPRETDVIARLYGHYEPADGKFINELETYVVVECKSTDKPWIGFRGAPIHHWDSDLFLTNKFGKRLIDSVKTQAGKTDLFTTKKYCHSAAFAFHDEGRAFAAMMAVMKAAESTYKSRTQVEKDSEFYISNSYAPIIHAAIVVSGPVFECKLTNENAIDLTEVPVSSVALQYPRQRQDSGDSFVIHVVSEKHLPVFIESVIGSHQAAADQLNKFTPPKAAAQQLAEFDSRKDA